MDAVNRTVLKAITYLTHGKKHGVVSYGQILQILRCCTGGYRSETGKRAVSRALSDMCKLQWLECHGANIYGIRNKTNVNNLVDDVKIGCDAMNFSDKQCQIEFPNQIKFIDKLSDHYNSISKGFPTASATATLEAKYSDDIPDAGEIIQNESTEEDPSGNATIAEDEEVPTEEKKQIKYYEQMPDLTGVEPEEEDLSTTATVAEDQEAIQNNENPTDVSNQMFEQADEAKKEEATATPDAVETNLADKGDQTIKI